MPTYEYACKKCGEHFDVVQSFTDEPLKRHKGGCGGAVKKVFGSVGISFKGSGFYKTDSRSSSSKSSGNGADSKSDAASESKTEAKPEAKSPSTSESKGDTNPAGSSSAAKSKTSKTAS